jgi:hypothetical protein
VQIQLLAPPSTLAPPALLAAPTARHEDGPQPLEQSARLLCQSVCLEFGQHWGELRQLSQWLEGWTDKVRAQRDGQHETVERFSGFARQTIDQVRGLEGGIVARKQAERRSCQEVLERFQRPARPEQLGQGLAPLRQAVQTHLQRNLELQRLDTFQRESVAYYRTRAERVRDRLVSIATAVAAAQSEAVCRIAFLLPQHAGRLARESGLGFEQISALRAELTAGLEPVEWDVEVEPLAPEHLELGARETAQAEALCSRGKQELQEGLQRQPDSRELWASLASG